MAIRKPYDERRLALAISRIMDSVETKAKEGNLDMESSLKALHALSQLTPAYVKLLESVGMAKRLEEVESILKERPA